MTERPSEIKPALKGRHSGEAIKPSPASLEQPAAGPARMKPRHRGLMLSVVLVIVLPVLLFTIYLTVLAKPQFASQVGFTIRQEETGSASELMGGLSGLLGGPVQSNADLLFEYVQSQEIVERIAEDFNLIEHYSANWPRDPAFSIWPTATIDVGSSPRP